MITGGDAGPAQLCVVAVTVISPVHIFPPVITSTLRRKARGTQPPFDSSVPVLMAAIERSDSSMIPHISLPVGVQCNNAYFLQPESQTCELTRAALGSLAKRAALGGGDITPHPR